MSLIGTFDHMTTVSENVRSSGKKRKSPALAGAEPLCRRSDILRRECWPILLLRYARAY
jgi:hypothetical protein